MNAVFRSIPTAYGFDGYFSLKFNFPIIEIGRNLPLKIRKFADLPGSYWF